MKNQRKIFIINRLFSLLTVFLLFVFLVVMGILFFIIPKKTVSEIENRKLTEFPKVSFEEFFSGKLFDNLALYYSDNFAFRDSLVSLSFDLESKRGIRYDDVKFYGGSQTQGKNESKKINCVDEPLVPLKKSNQGNTSLKVGEEFIPLQYVQMVVTNESEYADLTSEDLKGEQRGPLFMIGDTALEIFYGNKNVALDYANTINAFRSALPSDIKVYDMVIPTHFEFGLPSKYKETVGTRQKPFIDEIYSNLSPDIVAVDAYSKIAGRYNKGDYLYFRSDHHWTALGAYFAYTQFIQNAGFEPLGLEKFEKKKIDRFLGTFYSSTYDRKLAGNPDYVEYYDPNVEYEMTNYRQDGKTTYKGTVLYENIKSDSSGYLVFTGGDIPCAVIKTNNNSGRKIIVFKESYGNAFIPFLLKHYDEIHVADIRTFPFDSLSYIKENQISDVLFMNNIMTSCTPARVMNIMNLLK